MATEKYTNNAQTTLTGAITNAQTTIPVAAFAGFPAAAQYRIIVDAEIMIVTGGAGTLTWTVSRGAEGTSNVSHLSAAPVTHVLTAGAIDQMRTDNSQQGTTAGLPTAEKAGRIYRATDGIYLYRDNGASWDAYGPIYPMTPPVLGAFTQVNFKSAGQLATATQLHGGIFLNGPADTNDSFSCLMKAIPAAPYSCIFNLAAISGGDNFSTFGVLWRDSVGTGLKCLYQDWEGSFFSFGTTPPVNVGAFVVGAARGTGATPHITANYSQLIRSQSFEWFRLRDDNTNQIYSLSVDGQNWHDLFSHPRNTDVTPDTVGIFVNPRNTASRAVSAVLRSYQETSP